MIYLSLRVCFNREQHCKLQFPQFKTTKLYLSVGTSEPKGILHIECKKVVFFIINVQDNHCLILLCNEDAVKY